MIRSVDVLAIALLLVGVSWGIVQRIYLPALPLPTWDTWGYLNPALSWLSGQGFQETDGRGWFYPAILFATIKIGGDFSWILRLQQCLSLLAAPLLWVGVRLWLSIYPRRSVLCHSIGVLLGAIAAFVYAVGSIQIQLEQAIGPEGVLAFFVMVCLVSALAYFRARWVTLQTGLAIVFGSAVLVSGYAVILLRPSWSLAFIPVCFLVMAGILGSGRRYLRFAPAVAGVLLLAGASGVPYLVQFKRNPSRAFLPLLLVSIHAAQIVENADRHHRLGDGEAGLDNVERRFYQALAQVYSESRLKPFTKKTLGFDSDYIMHESGFFPTFQSKEKLTADQLFRLCYNEYFRTWRESPDLMAGKVAKQVRLFLTAPSKDLAAYTLSRDWFIDSIPLSFASIEWLTAEGKSLGYINQPFYTRYLAELERVYAEGLQIHQVNVQQRYLAVLFAKLSVWIQTAFFVAFFCVLLSRRLVDMRLWGLACASVAAILYGNVLTIAIVHTLDYERYRTSYASALLLTLVIMTVFVIGCSERLFRLLVSRSGAD